jgi:hypothetical protein
MKSFIVKKGVDSIQINVKSLPVLKAHKMKTFLAQKSMEYSKKGLDNTQVGISLLCDIEEPMIKEILSYCYIEKENELLYLSDENILQGLCQDNDNLIEIIANFMELQGFFTNLG